MGCALLLGAVVLMSSGCAWVVKPPEDQALARAVLAFHAELNSDIHQFKGIGHLRMQTNDQTLSGRVAWAAEMNKKLRVEWLNPMGQPLTRLAADGQTILLYSINDTQLHRLKQSESALSSVLHMPVGIEELTALLVGQLPVPDHVAAWMTVDNGDKQTIELKNRWSTTVAEFQVATKERRLQTMTLLKSDGTFKYQIQWTQWQTIGNRHLPRQIQLIAENGDRLTLGLERYWFDVNLPPDTFVLTEPDH